MATAAELAALRDRISTILIGSACARIVFRLAGQHIRPGGFTVIGMSIGISSGATPHGSARQRQMRVAVMPMPMHVGASYNAQRNEIQVPTASYGATVNERMCIVHESMHAVFDYHQIRMSAYLEEAAAYIAGAMYLRLTYSPLIGSGIFGVAEAIANDLTLPGPPGATVHLRPWTDTVTPAQQQRLIDAIRASPTYSGLSHQHAGLRYRHDGGRI